MFNAEAFNRVMAQADIEIERIRKGEIDRRGSVYKNMFGRDLILPENLRPELQKPIGIVMKETSELMHLVKNKIIIAVGDIISSELKKEGVVPAISIIDFKTRRHEIDHQKIDHAFHAHNQQGTITSEAVTASETE